MKNQIKHKHQSYWKNIKINTKGIVFNFELNEKGGLKYKLPRQSVRNISIEMQKLLSEDLDFNQNSITEKQNSITEYNMLDSNNCENSELNMTTTLSSNLDNEQIFLQMDDNSLFSDDMDLFFHSDKDNDFDFL